MLNSWSGAQFLGLHVKMKIFKIVAIYILSPRKVIVISYPMNSMACAGNALAVMTGNPFQKIRIPESLVFNYLLTMPLSNYLLLCIAS